MATTTDYATPHDKFDSMTLWLDNNKDAYITNNAQYEDYTQIKIWQVSYSIMSLGNKKQKAWMMQWAQDCDKEWNGSQWVNAEY
jgi:hypothetical protein